MNHNTFLEQLISFLVFMIFLFEQLITFLEKLITFFVYKRHFFSVNSALF